MNLERTGSPATAKRMGLSDWRGIGRLFDLSSLRTRICIAAVSCAVASLGVTCFAIAEKGRAMAEESAVDNVTLTARGAARDLEAALKSRLQVLHVLAASVAQLKAGGHALDRAQLDMVLKQALVANPDWASIYSVWEPDAFDAQDAKFAGKPPSDASGRYVTGWDRLSGAPVSQPIVGYDSPTQNDWYETPRRTLKDVWTEPFFYPFNGRQIWETDLVVPIVVEGRFLGVIGTDYVLDSLRAHLAGAVSTPGARVALVSAQGTYVSHTDLEAVGKKAGGYSPEAARALDAGETYHYADAGQIHVLAPLRISGDAPAWTLAISFPAAVAQERASQLVHWSIAIAAGCALLAGVLMVWTVTVLMRPLSLLVQVVEQLASGNANLRVALPTRGRDELARISLAFNSFVGKLADAFAAVRDASVGVDTAATEIANGNLDLSGRTEQQAASLENIASSIESLSADVRGNAANCREAALMTSEVKVTAERSADVVGNAVVSMEQVHNLSQRISEITSIIDGLAFQTNILALNAAVEAARAGTHGRGFAVVASEVRSLANHSASAAKDIKLLIDQSLGSVAQSTELIQETGRVVARMVEAVGKVTTQVDAINAATQRQAEGISMVEDSVGQLDTVTQQNAALVEEAAAAAASLRQQTGRVSETIAAFL